VDQRSEIREFLTTRRSRVSPDQAGIPVSGDRRVAGLRRGEVAALAGISVEYYTRLERGNLRGVSDSVLDAVSRALRLDDVQRTHLRNLATAANGSAARTSRRTPPSPVRPATRYLLAAMTMAAAFVRNSRYDILAANPLGRALYAPLFTAPLFTAPETPVNTARFVFLDERAPGFFVDWERVAADSVGALRVQAGLTPHDPALSALIGDLATRSDEFRVRWGAHDVYVHRHTSKRFRHPVIGEVELAVETMPLSGDPDQVLVAYSAAPGSPAEDGLRLLASWAAADQSTVEAARTD
jgi:hypothetical protein